MTGSPRVSARMTKPYAIAPRTTDPGTRGTVYPAVWTAKFISGPGHTGTRMRLQSRRKADPLGELRHLLSSAERFPAQPSARQTCESDPPDIRPRSTGTIGDVSTSVYLHRGDG